MTEGHPHGVEELCEAGMRLYAHALRPLDEVTGRLLLIDGSMAFTPATKAGTLALEVRHPSLSHYLATTFDRLRLLATPMYPEAVQPPTLNGVSPRQRAIASLLVEGHTDASIADRLEMNIRTARVLPQALGFAQAGRYPHRQTRGDTGQ